MRIPFRWLSCQGLQFWFLESRSQVPAGSPHSAVALEKAVAEAVGRIPARCKLWRVQAACPGFHPLWNTRPLSEGLSLYRTPGAGSMEALGPSSTPTYSVELEDI